MTFDPSIPLASDPPGNFPTQSQTNFSRLKTLISADHQFNNTAATDDGYHNIVHLTAQTPNAAAVPASGRLYAKADGLGRLQANYMDDTPGTSLNYQITPTLPIRAAVNFDGTGAIRGTAYNVSSVTLLSGGHYKVNFTNNMPGPGPEGNYIVQVTGMGTNTGVRNSCMGAISGDGTYGNSMNIAYVIVSFTDFTASGPAPAFVNPTTGCVTIFSVT